MRYGVVVMPTKFDEASVLNPHELIARGEGVELPLAGIELLPLTRSVDPVERTKS
jgi:hypothetical protein